ncbi:transcription factor Opi1-domain-containing protein [Gongronella butleri]|nr:transcription factor Opi1-domain-containing protein [Gongronella butleri]
MAEPHSLMSINQLIHEDVTNDKDRRMAAEALGSLAQPPAPHPSSDASSKITLPPLASPASPLQPSNTSSFSDVPRFSFSSDVSSFSLDDDLATSSSTSLSDIGMLSPSSSTPLMHRVSNLPLVNSALRAYEQSNVSKYGNDVVESIYDRFSAKEAPDHHDEDTMAAVHALARTTLSDDKEGMRRRRHPEDDHRKIRSRPHSRSTSPTRPYNTPRHHHHAPHPHAPAHYHRPAASKSKWQQIVMHAGSAAGTTAAVVSEQSMKSLRYCLHWLEYAKQHIQQQMHLLRNFLVSLATSKHASSSKTVARPHDALSDTLSNIQKEIVLTLRKVVEVISKYAGVGLPGHAKASVRSFILQLPGRWASINTQVDPSTVQDDESHTVPEHVRETSMKLLNFGGESIEMLDSVSTVFSDSIYRAEVWLDRLSILGGGGSGNNDASSSSRRASLHNISNHIDHAAPNTAPSSLNTPRTNLHHHHAKSMDVDCN